jgi:hypothetical protein
MCEERCEVVGLGHAEGAIIFAMNDMSASSGIEKPRQRRVDAPAYRVYPDAALQYSIASAGELPRRPSPRNTPPWRALGQRSTRC